MTLILCCCPAHECFCCSTGNSGKNTGTDADDLGAMYITDRNRFRCDYGPKDSIDIDWEITNPATAECACDDHRTPSAPIRCYRWDPAGDQPLAPVGTCPDGYYPLPYYDGDTSDELEPGLVECAVQCVTNPANPWGIDVEGADGMTWRGHQVLGEGTDCQVCIQVTLISICSGWFVEVLDQTNDQVLFAFCFAFDPAKQDGDSTVPIATWGTDCYGINVTVDNEDHFYSDCKSGTTEVEVDLTVNHQTCCDRCGYCCFSDQAEIDFYYREDRYNYSNDTCSGAPVAWALKTWEDEGGYLQRTCTGTWVGLTKFTQTIAEPSPVTNTFYQWVTVHMGYRDSTPTTGGTCPDEDASPTQHPSWRVAWGNTSYSAKQDALDDGPVNGYGAAVAIRSLMRAGATIADDCCGIVSAEQEECTDLGATSRKDVSQASVTVENNACCDDGGECTAGTQDCDGDCTDI